MCAACVARQPPGIRQTPGGRRLRAHDCPCWRVTPLLLSNGSPLSGRLPVEGVAVSARQTAASVAVGRARGDHWPDERVALPRVVVVYPRGAEPGLARPARRRRRCLQGRPPVGRAAAAGQPAGVLMASPRTVSGGASAERGRGRSQRASCGGGRLIGCCRDSDRPHATRPGPPAAAAHHRQSGDLDPESRRSSCAASSTRSAARRVSPSSPRARHQPELATERPNNGAITNPCCAVIRPLRRPQVLHRTRTPLPPAPPLTHWRPGRSSGQRSAGLWPSLSMAHDGEGGPRTRSIRPIRQDQQFWYERPAGPAGIRPTIRNTSACPAPSRPLSPARAYAVVRRTRRRGGAMRGAAVRAGWGRPPRGVACACCARYSTSWSPASSSSCSLMML